VVDPSHGTGHANLVASMAAASVAAGADGLIIEVHPDPKSASSDGGQTLDFAAFERMMQSCRRIAAAVDRTC
jgi:3-deoxy-7-phosphoheptulonate synthase